MKSSSLVSYFFAGCALTNSVPHFVMGLTGRRNMLKDLFGLERHRAKTLQGLLTRLVS